MEVQEEVAIVPDSEYLDKRFPCKSRLCVICVSEVLSLAPGLIENEVERGVVEMSPEIFLNGLSILCERLGLERRYGTARFWELVGEEDFVRLICCMDCYRLLEGLVTLQELILATQKSLAENVSNIENCVIDTAGRLEDVEFSVNSCFLFRRDVLSNYQQKRHRDSCRKASHRPGPASSKRRKISNEVKTEPPSLQSCFVKLEKLESSHLPRRNPNAHVDDDGDMDSETISYFDPVESILCSPLSPNDIQQMSKVKDDEDEDFKPVRRRRRGGAKPRKRGRPKKIRTREELQKLLIKRKRGRPPKPKPFDEVKVKRPKGRPRKRRALPMESVSINDMIESPFDDDSLELEGTENEVAMNSDDKLDEEYNPEEDDRDIAQSDVEEEYQPAIEKQAKNRKDGKVYKRPAGRSRKSLSLLTIARAKQLNNDGPYIKPVIVINSECGLYSYHNVRIQRDNTTLLCKHPGCNFYVGDMAYFSDQLAFRTMKLHVKASHRLRNRPSATNSEYSEYYNIDANFYSCCYCEDQFENKNRLLDHVRSSHPNVEPLPTQCEVCGERMARSVILKHLNTHKNREEQKVAEDWKCKRRGKSKDLTAPLDFPCDQCDKVFKCHTELRTHKRSHIPIEMRKHFQCDICGERLSTPNNLKHHKIRVHFKEELTFPYVCHICNRKYSSSHKTKYDIHMRLHTGERPYQCPQCGKGFSSNYNLTLHERLHVDTKIQCEYCPNWYKNAKYLRTHHRKHHPEMVQHPNFKVTQKYRNAEHVPDFIGPKMAHPCEPCGKVYTYKSQLVSHMRHRHKLFLAKTEEYPEQNTFEMQMLRDSGKMNQSKELSSSSPSENPSGTNQFFG